MSDKKDRFYTFVVGLLLCLFKIFYRLAIFGKENIPKSGSLIVVSNHTSYLDPIVIGLVVFPRPINFMAKEELFSIPVLKSLVRSLYAFPVKRGKPDREAFKTSLHLLAEGKVLGLFPEGTRRRLGLGQLGSGESGAALIALKSGAPILPMAIIGTDKVIPEGKRVPRFPKIKVVISKPFHVGFNRRDKKEIVTKTTEEIMERIGTLLRENLNGN